MAVKALVTEKGGISVRLTTKRTPHPGGELKPETK
jgi:hypothetical protein